MKQHSNIDTFMMTGSGSQTAQSSGRRSGEPLSPARKDSGNGLDQYYQRATRVPLLDAESEQSISTSMALAREAMALALGRVWDALDHFSHTLRTSELDGKHCAESELIGAPASSEDSETISDSLEVSKMSFLDIMQPYECEGSGRRDEAPPAALQAAFFNLRPTFRVLKSLCESLEVTQNRVNDIEERLYQLLVEKCGMRQNEFMSTLDAFGKRPDVARHLISQPSPWQVNVLQSSAELTRLGRQYFEAQAALGTPVEAVGQILDSISKDSKTYSKCLNDMVSANLRWVIKLARSYRNMGVAIEDLVQDGNVGLIRAAEKFVPHKGYKFSTYATWWIRQGITRAISDRSRTVRVPVHMSERISKVRRARRELTNTLGQTPTDDDIAQATGFSPKAVASANIADAPTFSLQTPIGDDQSDCHQDSLPDTGADQGSSPQQDIRAALLSLLSTVDERDELVIRLRFGVDTDTHTLEQVANILDLSRERIRQIEARALRRLREAASDQNMEAFFSE